MLYLVLHLGLAQGCKVRHLCLLAGQCNGDRNLHIQRQIKAASAFHAVILHRMQGDPDRFISEEQGGGPGGILGANASAGVVGDVHEERARYREGQIKKVRFILEVKKKKSDPLVHISQIP